MEGSDGNCSQDARRLRPGERARGLAWVGEIDQRRDGVRTGGEKSDIVCSSAVVVQCDDGGPAWSSCSCSSRATGALASSQTWP